MASKWFRSARNTDTRGTGVLNGVGGFRFMVTAIDGQLPGGGGTDLLRIKIWNGTSGGVVYDNKPGTADDEDPSTALGGGQIKIHSK